jgi:molybdate transport system ATP-binding protein
MPEITWPWPHHELSVEATLGPLHLDASLRLHAPWTVIFGPSGSGKSSLLRAACGLIPEATVDFRRRTSDSPKLTIEDPPSSTVLGAIVIGQSLAQRPTHLRALAYAPQHAALFPHLTAEGNIRFPSEVSLSQPKDTAMVDQVMDLFHLQSLSNRMPAQLSGGERRRVALARAFAVPNTRLMLLDEPFTGLDRALRDELLPRMQAWLAARKIPVLSVTHDVDEALLLNADVIRLEEGRVIAQGPAREVLAAERNRMLQTLTEHD